MDTLGGHGKEYMGLETFHHIKMTLLLQRSTVEMTNDTQHQYCAFKTPANNTVPPYPVAIHSASKRVRPPRL